MGSKTSQCFTAFLYRTKFTASCHTAVLGKVGKLLQHRRSRSTRAAAPLGGEEEKKNNLLRLKRLRTETHSKAILGTVICSLISTAHSDLEEAGYADSRCKFETASPAMQAGSVDSAAEPAAMFLSPLYRLWEAFNRLFESLQGVPIVETR